MVNIYLIEKVYFSGRQGHYLEAFQERIKNVDFMILLKESMKVYQVIRGYHPRRKRSRKV